MPSSAARFSIHFSNLPFQPLLPIAAKLSAIAEFEQPEQARLEASFTQVGVGIGTGQASRHAAVVKGVKPTKDDAEVVAQVVFFRRAEYMK